MGGRIALAFCNRDEALSFAKTEDLDQAIKVLHDHCDEFVITLGAEGALIYDGETMHAIDGVKVEAIDTNGAGDMFAGAFLYGISHGMTHAQAGKFASLAASRVVSQFGPRLQPPQHAKLLEQFQQA